MTRRRPAPAPAPFSDQQSRMTVTWAAGTLARRGSTLTAFVHHYGWEIRHADGRMDAAYSPAELARIAHFEITRAQRAAA